MSWDDPVNVLDWQRRSILLMDEKGIADLFRELGIPPSEAQRRAVMIGMERPSTTISVALPALSRAIVEPWLPSDEVPDGLQEEVLAAGRPTIPRTVKPLRFF